MVNQQVKALVLFIGHVSQSSIIIFHFSTFHMHSKFDV